MASYTVPVGHIGVHEKTLVANTVDSVTFALGSTSNSGWANMSEQIEIITDGTADIYVTVDGTTPTVAGTDCWRVPAMAGASSFDVPRPTATSPVVVKLVSAGTPKYSVGRS